MDWKTMLASSANHALRTLRPARPPTKRCSVPRSHNTLVSTERVG